jgi:predicted nucleotidyltransferase
VDEARLTQARDRLLREFVNIFSSDPAVVGIFAGGSVAVGNADAWSDIDLRVLVVHDKHASFVSQRRDIPKKVGGFLFNEWLHGAIHCISHFSDFVKVDVFYLDASAFAPSPWYGLPILILYDPTSVINDVVEKSKSLYFQLDPQEIDRSVSKGVAAIHEAYRRLRRGELVFVQSLLDELRQHMAFADDWIHGRPPQAVPFSRLETRASDSLLRAFQQSFVVLDERVLGTALRTLAVHYRGQIAQLVALSGVPLDGHMQALGLVTDEIAVAR